MKKVITIAIIVWVTITAQSFYQPGPNKLSYENGKTVYTTYCISCHMEDGNGLEGVFPSLVKTGNLADKNRMVKIILQGMRGKIKVKETVYDAEMAAIAISDKEVADVINYVRNSWGNKAPYIKVSDVEAGKKAEVKGYQPF